MTDAASQSSVRVRGAPRSRGCSAARVTTCGSGRARPRSPRASTRTTSNPRLPARRRLRRRRLRDTGHRGGAASAPRRSSWSRPSIGVRETAEAMKPHLGRRHPGRHPVQGRRGRHQHAHDRGARGRARRPRARRRPLRPEPRRGGQPRHPVGDRRRGATTRASATCSRTSS